MLNRPGTTEAIARAASARFGQPARTAFVIGQPPEQTASEPKAEPQEDALDELLDFGSKFDNIVIE